MLVNLRLYSESLLAGSSLSLQALNVGMPLGCLLLKQHPSPLVTSLSSKTLNTIAAAAKLLQSCQTLCDPIEGSQLGSPVPGILQARTLEWVAISFSNAWKWKVKVKSLSRGRLLAILWTAAYQVPPSMGFSRQEYWTGVPLPSPTKYHYRLTKHRFIAQAINW